MSGSNKRAKFVIFYTVITMMVSYVFIQEGVKAFLDLSAREAETDEDQEDDEEDDDDFSKLVTSWFRGLLLTLLSCYG